MKAAQVDEERQTNESGRGDVYDASEGNPTSQPVEEKAYSTSQDRITSINILGFHTLAH